jgi:hypothetical protein
LYFVTEGKRVKIRRMATRDEITNGLSRNVSHLCQKLPGLPSIINGENDRLIYGRKVIDYN